MAGQNFSHDEETSSDPIEGLWSPRWSMGDGDATPAEDLRDVTLTFVGGRCEVHRAGRLIRSGSYSTDPTRTPRTIDVHFTDSDVPELIDAVLRGIFEVDTDQLRICYGPPGGHRAATFSGDAGTGQYLADYCRV